MDVSVILSATEDSAYLEKSIWGFFKQSLQAFEIIVADSSHAPDPSARLQRLRRETGLTIHHLRRRNRDERQSAVLNLAIERSAGAYLVFSEDRCVPRWDFLEAHTRRARPGLFLAGRSVPLDDQLTRLIDRKAIVTGRATDFAWLRQKGLQEESRSRASAWRTRLGSLWAGLLGPRAEWNSANASCWKADLMEVNGFDERVEQGALDQELGERLQNLRVRGRSVQPWAVCMRLHSRPRHLPREALERNLALAEATRRTRATWTPFGIRKGYRVIGLNQDTAPAAAGEQHGRAVA